LDKTILPSQGHRAVLYFCTHCAEEQKLHFNLLAGVGSIDRFLRDRCITSSEKGERRKSL